MLQPTCFARRFLLLAPHKYLFPPPANGTIANASGKNDKSNGKNGAKNNANGNGDKQHGNGVGGVSGSSDEERERAGAGAGAAGSSINTQPGLAGLFQYVGTLNSAKPLL